MFLKLCPDEPDRSDRMFSPKLSHIPHTLAEAIEKFTKNINFFMSILYLHNNPHTPSYHTKTFKSLKFSDTKTAKTKWRTTPSESWNTFTTDLVETADFIENSGIIDCLIAIRTASQNHNVNNTFITTRY